MKALQTLVRDRILKLPPRPELRTNAQPAERLADLRELESWTGSTTDRLAVVGRGAGQVALGALLAAGTGAALTVAQLLSGGPVTAPLLLTVCGAITAGLSHAFRQQVAERRAEGENFQPRIALAVQRAQGGVDQLQAEAEARAAAERRPLEALVAPPRSGLEERSGYLWMPGVRLKSR